MVTPARSKRHFKLSLKGAFCVVGMVFCLGRGTSEALDTYYLEHRGEVVTATVLDMHFGKTSSIDVRYVTKTGETVEASTSNYYDGEVGHDLQVIYDPRNPQRVQGVDYGLDYFMASVWAGGALLFGWFAFVQLWPKRVSKYAKPASPPKPPDR